MIILVIAALFGAGPLMLHKARRHDARLDAVEAAAREAAEEEAQTRYEDDCDAWRKGER